MKKLLVTGGTGYLGHRVTQLAEEWEVTYTWFQTNPDVDLDGHAKQVDLRDYDEVQKLFEECHPDAIIHTACSDRSENSIVTAARNISVAADFHDTRLVHVSTDMVLDGNKPPYDEEAPACPVSSYGRAKAKAESLVTENVRSAVIVRTSLIFGVDPIDRQTRWLVDGLESGHEVRLFKDEYRCPIWVDNIATALLELAGINYAGFLNVAGRQVLSRWKFGMMMLELLRLQPGQNILPAHLEDSGMTRPANLTLDTSLAQGLMRTPLLRVDEAIERIHTGRAM